MQLLESSRRVNSDHGEKASVSQWPERIAGIVHGNFMGRVFRLHDLTRKGQIKSRPLAVQAGGKASSCSQQCLGRQERHLSLFKAACETELPRRRRAEFMLAVWLYDGVWYHSLV